jgi:hypothetical protein
MINPKISELLSGVATSLDETVLPELAPGFARNQLVAAVALIRRAAIVGDNIGSYLWEDNRDITMVLSELAPVAGLEPPPTAVNTEYPTVDELRRRNLALQQHVVAVHDSLRAQPNSDASLGVLRALFERMLAREAEINTSSWV